MSPCFDLPPGLPHTNDASPREKEYVIINGVRHVAPYVHRFVIRVSPEREGKTLLHALDAHCKFHGNTEDDSGREFWVRVMCVKRVVMCGAHWQDTCDAEHSRSRSSGSSTSSPLD